MGYKIIFTKKSSLDFKHLDNSVKKKIEKYIDKLIARESPKSIGEQLAENLKAYNSAYEKMVSGELSRIDAAKAIGKVYGKGEIASGTNLNYNDYYGGFYGK